MIDRQLMERYIGGRDSSAFRDLVSRHGPAVLRICRRLVHDQHEAEDAMQATFLILVQRAPTIREPEQIDRWLAGVARRVALRARQRAIRRSEREHHWAESHQESAVEGEQIIGGDLRRVIREELGHLSDADRRPLTLCYLDGLTHEEAARQIGCPVGTIKARLVRARRRLRDRLDRRGVALGLTLLLCLLRRPTSVSASAGLAESTVTLMTLVRSGDLDSVRKRFPNVLSLSQPSWSWPGLRLPSSPFLLMIGLVMAILAGGTIVVRASSERAETRKAFARLAKVLEVNCRINP